MAQISMKRAHLSNSRQSMPPGATLVFPQSFPQRLAHFGKTGPRVVAIPKISHQVLAEMVGTTRQRVNLFMNRFRKRGFIDYDGGSTLEVRQSLRKVLRKP